MLYRVYLQTGLDAEAFFAAFRMLRLVCNWSHTEAQLYMQQQNLWYAKGCLLDLGVFTHNQFVMMQDAAFHEFHDYDSYISVDAVQVWEA
jgi:hypothetical protein